MEGISGNFTLNKENARRSFEMEKYEDKFVFSKGIAQDLRYISQYQSKWGHSSREKLLFKGMHQY